MIKKKSDISVIIPCYNGWQYIDKCLCAFENQTVIPHEIIIVDDCSTDDSYEKLTDYKSLSEINIIVKRNEKNCGPSISREKAIAVASGKYVAFCDCDDWYETNFIEEISKAIKDSNADLIMCDYYTAYDDRKIPSHITKSLVGSKKRELLTHANMSLWILVGKKGLFDEIVFPPLYNGEDAAIIPQLIAKAEKVAIVDKPLYNYYFREDSLSKRPDAKAYLGMLKAFHTVNKTIKDNYPAECECIGINYVCYGATLNAFKTGTSKKAVRDIMTEFEAEYPNWYRSVPLLNLGRIKTIYLWFLRHKCFLCVRLMALFHHCYTKRRKK